MAKEKKVCIRDTPKYSSSSDEESSNDEVDYTDLFKGLDKAKVDKINELIDALNEKDRLLENQEDILYEEHDKFISVQKSLALEIKRNDMLSSELSTSHESITTLKNLNDELNAKLDEVNAISSSVEHVVICDRCKDIDLDKHVTAIVNLNNEVASLNAQLKTCKDDYDKLKFARDAYTIGRHPLIKDGLGFRKETKNLTSQRTSDLKGKGRLLWLVAHIPHMIKRNMPIFMLMLRKVLIIIGVMIMLLYLFIMIHMLCLLLALLMLMVKIGLGVIMLSLMSLGEIAIVLLLSIMLVMLLLCCHAKCKSSC
jgi:hypothetical protein